MMKHTTKYTKHPLFRHVYVEEAIKDHARVQHILSRLGKLGEHPIFITKLSAVWGRMTKPYHARKRMLDLILAQRRGQLVKKAPAAYGTTAAGNEMHFYFVHAYNCIYACEYCYLQGYFNSPDIVLFVNYEDIFTAITENIAAASQQGKVAYFHSGEFSDSLALSEYTGELPLYFNFFKEYPQAYLELRTKSVRIASLLQQPPLGNVITSFSLAPPHAIRRYDHKTAHFKARLHAISRLTACGFPVAVHLDPIIYDENFIASYEQLSLALRAALGAHLGLLRHISLGTLRFSADVWSRVKENHPFSTMFRGEWTAARGFDGKFRYPRPLSKWMLTQVRTLLRHAGIPDHLIYHAME